MLQKCKFIYWISISIQGLLVHEYWSIFSWLYLRTFLCIEEVSTNPEVLQTLKGIKLDFDKNVSKFSVGHETLNEQQIWFMKTYINYKKRGLLCHINLNNGGHKHFKMQIFQSVLSLMQPNCHMAIIDLKEVYNSVKTDILNFHLTW